jgi:hypothetical protein
MDYPGNFVCRSPWKRVREFFVRRILLSCFLAKVFLLARKRIIFCRIVLCLDYTRRIIFRPKIVQHKANNLSPENGLPNKSKLIIFVYFSSSLRKRFLKQSGKFFARRVPPPENSSPEFCVRDFFAEYSPFELRIILHRRVFRPNNYESKRFFPT